VNPRTAIDGIAFLMTQPDLFHQFFATLALTAGRPPGPGVIACTRDFQYFAHQIHRILLSMFMNEGELQFGSLAK
jgi:hypothetical protein